MQLFENHIFLLPSTLYTLNVGVLRRRDQFVSELEAGEQGTDGASSQVRGAHNTMLMKFQREIIGFSLN